MRFLRGSNALWLTVLLAVQGAAYYALASRPELTPPMSPLGGFPETFQGWQGLKDFGIDADTEAVLKADDTLNREYISPAFVTNAKYDPVIFFVAYFKTQRTGATPHSPKNCLPGAGFEPVEPPGTIEIPVSGRPDPLTANRYIVARGDDKMVVLYWYQSHNRTIANEFSAKFWLVADAIRYRRSDTSVVKVQVPVIANNSAGAVREAVSFVQAAYPALARQLP
ncbi:MAG TPA: EpsI family protein [Bryobacteraceae bacterium]|nr:EpsI family protein [Bryobacteraceae bacterium]